MAASGSATASGGLMVNSLVSSCGNFANFVKPIGVCFNDRVGCRSFQRWGMRLKSREPYNNRQTHHFIFDVTHRPFSFNPAFDTCQKNCHAFSSPYYSDGFVPDWTVNGLLCIEQHATTTVSADQKLKLLSGLCYLPHLDKEETGGEDAHFICVNEQVIGVADVTSIVLQGRSERLNAEELSKKLAASARERALDRHRLTPFSTGYYGGKLDVVSYIMSIRRGRLFP